MAKNPRYEGRLRGDLDFSTAPQLINSSRDITDTLHLNMHLQKLKSTDSPTLRHYLLML